MKNEKTVALESNGSNTDLAHGSTNKINSNGESISMNNNTRNQNKFQIPNFDESPNTSRRDLLESTKLSRLPKLPTRPKFELPEFELSSVTATAAVCVGCGGRLDGDDNFQQSIKVCRKCLAHYAKIDSAIDEASKRKRRKILERFAGGAK